MTAEKSGSGSDHLGAADLDRYHRGAAVGGHCRGRRADRLAAEPEQPERALRPRRHGRHHRRHAAGVRSPGAAVWALGRALRLLQSYRRFAAPSIGPGISSLVLIACYLAFVPLDQGAVAGQLPASAELVLSEGPRWASPRWSSLPYRRHGGCGCGCGQRCGSARGGAPCRRHGAGRRRRAGRDRRGERRSHRAG